MPQPSFARPERVTLTGRHARLEPLDAARHGDALYSASMSPGAEERFRYLFESPQLRSEFDAFDLLRATFPAGTVSGAPKVRAMEIIEELEPTKRGVYAGSVGYFSYSGNMDTCITIRTLVIKGGVAYIQAGGGVVADSDPTAEYQETVNKAKAMMRAVEMAEKGLE